MARDAKNLIAGTRDDDDVPVGERESLSAYSEWVT